MRANHADLATLLRPRERRARGASAIAVARAHRLSVLKLLAKFGHCRTSDVARAVWPDATYALQMSHRTLRRLLASGHVLYRRNALGSRSFILSRIGVAELACNGIAARHGGDLVSIAGATFLHRCIETRHCIEVENTGALCYGEYAIAGGAAPVTARKLAQYYGKLPDSLAVRHPRAIRPGHDTQSAAEVDWTEVEASAKPTEQICRMLNIARYVAGPLAGNEALTLSRLVLVFDASGDHGRRIVRAASVAWRDLLDTEQRRISKRVVLVAVTFTEGYRWMGSQEATLYDLLYNPAASRGCIGYADHR